jgi:hypothetical protein
MPAEIVGLSPTLHAARRALQTSRACQGSAEAEAATSRIK